MIVDKYGQLFTKIYVATVWIGVDISLTVHSCAILKIVKSMSNGIKKNQMHAYEMSYKCQLYSVTGEKPVILT
jgi:hypothetical protein